MHAIENHDPPFLDEIIDELFSNNELINFCGYNVQCLFDYNQTGDSTIAAQTAMFLRNSQYRKELNCKCDCMHNIL